VVLGVLMAGAFSQACGYALAGRGSFLPADVRVVGVPQLVNQSTFFNVEQLLSEKLRGTAAFLLPSINRSNG